MFGKKTGNENKQNSVYPIMGDQGAIGPYYPPPSEFTHHLQNPDFSHPLRISPMGPYRALPIGPYRALRALLGCLIFPFEVWVRLEACLHVSLLLDYSGLILAMPVTWILPHAHPSVGSAGQGTWNRKRKQGVGSTE